MQYNLIAVTIDEDLFLAATNVPDEALETTLIKLTMKPQWKNTKAFLIQPCREPTHDETEG